MSVRLVAMLFAMSALSASALGAQVFGRAESQLLQDMQRQPNDLARYVFLLKAVRPRMEPVGVLAAQFIAFAQNELGLYTQAILDFPFAAKTPQGWVLPATSQWRGASAVDAISTLAQERRLVLINEAHHNAHTRQLTLALLPRLRALGFNYFAAEALSLADTDLTARGYPVNSSGSEYLHEPLYGDMVREALRLGFHVIAYDAGSGGQAREDAQAQNLYQAVFAHDPDARLFVHAGYAHIDKAPGRLDKVEPMAMRLHELTGLEPLSIDQTDFLESAWDRADVYQQLIGAFPSTQAEVLLSRTDDHPWSARPAQYDLNVILPPSLTLAAFGDRNSYGGELAGKLTKLQTSQVSPLIPNMTNIMQRPAWLTLEGQRRPWSINVTLCRSMLPCVVAARYANESDQAIAADRYAFLADHATSTLYLRPGNYRLQATDLQGRVISAQTLTIPDN